MAPVLLFILLAAATAVVLFILELALLMGDVAWRPSTVLLVVTGKTRQGLYHVFLGLCMLADVFGFVRRFALLMRDLFFQWIPRDKLLQALRDLGAAFGSIWRVPMGALDGIWDGISDARSPLIAAVLVGVAVLVTPVALELLADTLGWDSLRQTLWYNTVATWVYAPFWELGHALEYFGNVRELVVRILSLLFGWVPLAKLRATTTLVYHSLWSAVSSPAAGLRDGFCSVVPCALPPVSASVVWAIVVLAVLVPGIMWCCAGPASPRIVYAAPAPADDDYPRELARSTRSRRQGAVGAW